MPWPREPSTALSAASCCSLTLPQDDPELYRINLNAAQKAREKGETVPVVYVEIEALAPPRSRLVNPRLTTPSSLRPTTA